LDCDAEEAGLGTPSKGSEGRSSPLFHENLYSTLSSSGKFEKLQLLAMILSFILGPSEVALGRELLDKKETGPEGVQGLFDGTEVKEIG
jgi:hypothetical protein